jgi:hypothetical protein
VYGEQSARKLVRAVKAEKARRKGGGQITTPSKHTTTTPVKTSVRVARLPALVREVTELDADTGHAWEALVDYSRRRHQLLERIKGHGDDESAVVESLSEMTRILLRIEGKLGEIAEVEEREEAAIASATKVVAQETSMLVEKAGELAEKASASLTVTKADEITAPPPESPAPLAQTANGGGPAAPQRRLSDLSEDELLLRVARLDHALDRSRRELISRYAKVEEEIARLRPKLARREAQIAKRHGGTKIRTPGKRTPAAKDPSGGPNGGKVVVTKVGDRGLLVRRSKRALVRYLKQKGTT